MDDLGFFIGIGAVVLVFIAVVCVMAATMSPT